MTYSYLSNSGSNNYNCLTACDFGFNGSQCQQLCSVNCIKESCYHTNGECIGGCKSGWNGFNCTNGW